MGFVWAVIGRISYGYLLEGPLLSACSQVTFLQVDYLYA